MKISDQESASAFGARRVFDQTRKIRDEARSLENSVETLFTEAESALRQSLAESPYTTLGIAAGVGFVVAGGLGGRLTLGLAALTGRALAGMALQKALAGVLGSREREYTPEGMMEDA